MKDNHPRRRNIYMIGFSGSGKTSVLPILAELSGMRMVDMDKEIERMAGKSIAEIFDSDGEAKFRAMETDFLKHLANSKRELVVATGGGVPVSEENRKIMAETGFTVRLNVSLKTAEERLSKDSNTKRPMLDSTTAAILMKTREQFYSEADISVDTEGRGAEEIATLITFELRQHRAE